MKSTGMGSYIERYGTTINSISNTFKPVPSWTLEDGETMIKQLDSVIPCDKLQVMSHFIISYTLAQIE